MQRKDFKNAKVYKRQPFQYFNELACIVGNDIAEGTTAPTAHDNEEGNLMDEAVDLDDDGDFNTTMNNTTMDNATDLDNETNPSNKSSATGKQFVSPTTSRKAKRKKASMAGSMDVISDAINCLNAGLKETQNIRMDEGHLDSLYDKVYDALKVIPDISEDIMLQAFDSFLLESARAKGFLRMTEGERARYVQLKFGGL